MMLIVKQDVGPMEENVAPSGLLGGVRLILIVHAIMRVNEMHTKIGSRYNIEKYINKALMDWFLGQTLNQNCCPRPNVLVESLSCRVR